MRKFGLKIFSLKIWVILVAPLKYIFERVFTNRLQVDQEVQHIQAIQVDRWDPLALRLRRDPVDRSDRVDQQHRDNRPVPAGSGIPRHSPPCK